MTSKYYLIINKESVEEQLVKSEVKNIVPEIKVFRDKKYEVYNIQPPTPLPDLERFGRIEENFFDPSVFNKIKDIFTPLEKKNFEKVQILHENYMIYLIKKFKDVTRGKNILSDLDKLLDNIDSKNFYDKLYEELSTKLIKSKEFINTNISDNKILTRDIYYLKEIFNINKTDKDIYYQDILGDTPQDFLEGTAVAQVSGEDVNISVYMPSFGGWTEAIEQINYGEGLFIFNTQEGEITGYWIF